MSEAKRIIDVKKGEYIMRKPDAKTIYKKGEYCRQSKAFECTDVDDISRSIYIKSNKPVFVGFTY